MHAYTTRLVCFSQTIAQERFKYQATISALFFTLLTEASCNLVFPQLGILSRPLPVPLAVVPLTTRSQTSVTISRFPVPSSPSLSSSLDKAISIGLNYFALCVYARL